MSIFRACITRNLSRLKSYGRAALLKDMGQFMRQESVSGGGSGRELSPAEHDVWTERVCTGM